MCATARVPGCLRPNLGNFVANDLLVPYSHQASIGVARQLGAAMAIEADYVYTAERGTLAQRNINISVQPRHGANYPFTDVTRRPYTDWGNTSLNRPDNVSNYHALQVAFMKRMQNRWQASATYTLGGQWNYDQLPLNPGCQYPVTFAAPGSPVCDVPIQLAPDLAEDAVLPLRFTAPPGDVQRHLGYRLGYAVERVVHLRRPGLGDAHLRRRRAAARHGARRGGARGDCHRPAATQRDADRA